MSISRRYMPDGRRLNEYECYVDMSPYAVDLDDRKPCFRVEVWTHMSNADIGEFGDGLRQRGLLMAFAPTMRLFKANEHTAHRRAWWRFVPRFAPAGGAAPFTTSEAERMMEKMLAYLDSRPLPIIWKEDEHGYQIDKEGRIKRKWRLEPF